MKRQNTILLMNVLQERFCRRSDRWNTVAMLLFRLATADCQFIGLMKSQLLILREVITKWRFNTGQ